MRTISSFAISSVESPRRLIPAIGVLAALLSSLLAPNSPAAAQNANHRIEITMSEENLPSEDAPPPASPNTGDSNKADSDWQQETPMPAASPSAVATALAPQRGAEANPAAPAQPEAPSTAAQANGIPIAQATAAPQPTEVAPPLEAGSVEPKSQISDDSLQPYITSARDQSPALAASLRITDQAREEILAQREGDAIQALGRAISIDSANPYAYFYLGRAYLKRQNLAQAITFLHRAEIGFRGDPEWLSETLAFEGLAQEQSGQVNTAIAAYQKALQSEPGNLTARVGLTRLAGSEQPAPASDAQPVSETGGSLAQPAPPDDVSGPPPDAAPPQQAY